MQQARELVTDFSTVLSLCNKLMLLEKETSKFFQIRNQLDQSINQLELYIPSMKIDKSFNIPIDHMENFITHQTELIKGINKISDYPGYIVSLSSVKDPETFSYVIRIIMYLYRFLCEIDLKLRQVNDKILLQDTDQDEILVSKIYLNDFKTCKSCILKLLSNLVKIEIEIDLTEDYFIENTDFYSEKVIIKDYYSSSYEEFISQIQGEVRDLQMAFYFSDQSEESENRSQSFSQKVSGFINHMYRSVVKNFRRSSIIHDST